MIRIICLNPVIDRVYYISDFVEAKKYYEIRPQIFVGGKGINIARVMSQMGEKCSLYAFVGGENGKLIEKEMKNMVKQLLIAVCIISCSMQSSRESL